jgi:hypothetical protein
MGPRVRRRCPGGHEQDADPAGSSISQLGVEITDSPYLAVRRGNGNERGEWPVGMPFPVETCHRALLLGSKLAGQACPLFQVGEQLAGHLNAGREKLAEQLSRGHAPGLTG